MVVITMVICDDNNDDMRVVVAVTLMTMTVHSWCAEKLHAQHTCG